MKANALLLCLSSFVIVFTSAQARVVTIVVNHQNPEREIIVGSNEVARLQTYHTLDSASSRMEIHKDGVVMKYDNLSADAAHQLVIAGPARLTLMGFGASPPAAMCTFEILPESFPPDKTVIIPAGTGARVALECSTNLTQWTEIYSVTETNSPTHKFFRIKAERLQ